MNFPNYQNFNEATEAYELYNAALYKIHKLIFNNKKDHFEKNNKPKVFRFT